MKTVSTFWANIYVGFREHYDEKVHIIEEVETLCQHYVDDVGLCVTITPTKYVYKNGNESGCIVGLINYPRFPSTPDKIIDHAIAIASILLKEFRQYKISIVTPNETIMMESE